MSKIPFHQYGYISTEKSSGPLQNGELIVGVRNCLVGMANVQKGEKVLILADYEVDPLVVQAFIAVGTMLDASVAVLYDEPFSLGGKNPNIPNPLMHAACDAADVLISCCWFPDIHARGFFRPKGKSRRVSLYQQASVGALSSPGARFPVELGFKIMEKMRNLVEAAVGQKIHVTSPNGTDITAKITKGIQGALVRSLQAGEAAPFPLGVCGFRPEDANGVLYFDETYQLGESEAPIFMEFKNNKCVRIEGGGPGEAENVAAYMELGKKGTPVGELIEIMWGLNPKSRFKGAASQIERERHATTIHFGVATAYYSGTWHTHCDFFVHTPSISIGDRMVVDKRRLLLLEDKEIRNVAAKYGDPDKLLKPDVYL